METLKIWFVDFWPEIGYEDIFTPILTKHYNVVLDSVSPDVVFHSVFGGMKDIKNYPHAKKIMWIAENCRASQFKTDYTISFDPTEGTNIRLPLWQAYILKNPTLLDRLYEREKIGSACKFDRFCSFVVSNGNNFIRNSIYNNLNSYKRVHSYGKYMTNDFSLQTTGKPDEYWRDIKDNFFQNISHKFSICYENSSKKGYCTEKLMDGFLGNTVPIYFGDINASLDFNEESFINIHKYIKINCTNVIDVIKTIDNDDDLYLKIRNASVFTQEQKLDLQDNLDYFEKWLIEIINK